MMSTAEREALTAGFNATEGLYPKLCVQELFEACAGAKPESVALVFNDVQLTYGALNRSANALAWRLQQEGVGPDKVVAVFLDRSLDLIVAFIAILKAGGAYLPLDPGLPTERLAFMLQDTQAPVLITQQGLLEQLPQFNGRLLCLDRDWPTVATNPETVPSTPR